MGIKTPPAYVHPNKAKNASTKNITPKNIQGSDDENPIKKKGNEKSKATISRTKRSLTAEDTVIIRLVAHPPKAGEFPFFDKMMSSGLSPKQAIQALIGRGFETLDPKNLKPASYECQGAPIETNRAFLADDITILSEKFDPFSILSKRALGKKIGEALLVKAMRESENS